MKRLLWPLALAFACAGAVAYAETANVVSSCGGITYDVNTNMPVTQDTTGKACIGGTATSVSSIADGADVTQGAKADAKSTATDTTAVTIMQVMKEISAMVQAPPSQAATIVDGGSVTMGAKADAKSTATDTTAVTAMQVLKQISASVQAPPSQAVTNAGTFAAQAAVADGADVTQGAKADAKSTATDTTSVSAMQVLKEISAMEQAPASRAVTNAGTFAVQSTTQASQNGIGNVGGKTVRVCVAPTVTSATYGANVVMGGLLSFANLFTSTGSGIIQSISIDFTTAQTVGFKLYPFTSNPSNTTWTEHSAASINSADIFKVDPFISMTNYDSGLGTMTNYSLTGLGQSYSSGGTTGYFVLVPTATTATLGGTANVVQVCVTVIQDL